MASTKLATSHPAQAVGYQAQGRGSDGDGGVTAGSPPAGVGAVGARSNQLCENPLLSTSLRSVLGPKSNLQVPPSRRAQSKGPVGARGAAPDGPAPVAVAAPVRLKPRKFRFGTWNIQGRVDSSKKLKSHYAEQLQALEKIDLLVVTETHSLTFVCNKGTSVLCQSGISNERASIALISRASHSWLCNDARILIPGYALLAHLTHCRSTKSMWFLCVYADNSRRHTSLTAFYRLLLSKLAAEIRSIPDWPGCFAAGNWNFVEHPDNRAPRSPLPVPSAITRNFGKIKAVCSMKDIAGPEPLPGGWTHATQRAGRTYRARLDRVYCPDALWFPGDPVSLPTLWSDHNLVWVDCTLSRPRVQMAVPADCLPPVPKLDAQFWAGALAKYKVLTQSNVNLASWSVFKKDVLAMGVSSKHRLRRSKGNNWLAALRGDQLSQDNFDAALAWLNRGPRPKSSPSWRRPWPAAAPSEVVPPWRTRPRWEPSPNSPWFTTTVVSLVPPPPGLPPRPPASTPAEPDPDVIARAFARWMIARQAALHKKFAHMEAKHTSEWFNQSANKEADERGSRASISVEGLRLSDRHTATPILGEMVQIARRYFYNLHTPEPASLARSLAQSRLLDKVSAVYSDTPAPASFVSGPFTVAETPALLKTMHNTAPGPDGIQYSFWKGLATRISAHNKAHPRDALPDFWTTFVSLANDVKSHGSRRFRFKDANVSMFFKKGDPTLAKNYRPISAMNTDCKMYTNLINNRLAPWAVAKLHPDQKGFVPGRLITNHTRLAYKVAHLADSTGTNSYLVSLDQAKAYDRVDQSWLLRVLRRMNIDPDLCNTISDLITGCHSRVRINGGYSTSFSLRRGVRQGDPLSCLLFNFSIEPLAMRLRATLQGFSLLGLPPVKLMFYADDLNLFLRAREPLAPIKQCLDESCFAIGSLFNIEKTDIKPLGRLAFREACFASQSMNGEALPGGYVLAPNSPLRVLGVWVGSPDMAKDCWSQLSSHISSISLRWTSIGTSLPNRVLVAKALMLSRCYWLLDGNSIPGSWLQRISNKIMRFVRGSFSRAPYSYLEAPIVDGGLNCPSLISRKAAYNLKFLGDLISSPCDTPWKVWTTKDLTRSTQRSPNEGTPSSSTRDWTAYSVSQLGYELHPFLQKGHTRDAGLSPRLRSALRSARLVGIDTCCAFPSPAAKMSYPILNHPGISLQCSRNYRKLLSSKAISSVGDLVSRPKKSHGPATKQKVSDILDWLSRTPWDPAAPRPPPHHEDVVIWPNMPDALGCVRTFTAPQSIVATHVHMRVNTGKFAMAPYQPHLARPVIGPPSGNPDVISLWTDGSAFDNGLETCTAGSSWVSDLYIHTSVSLSGVPLSNNVAEIAAIVLALRSWPGRCLHIHTDSKFALKLIHGGLLSLEHNGWPDFPWLCRTTGPSTLHASSLYQHLLYRLRAHSAPLEFSWVKAHDGNRFNKMADFYAKDGWESGFPLRLDLLHTPPGWVDVAPALRGSPLSALTRFLVRHTLPCPITDYRVSPMADKWTYFMRRSFDTKVDLGACLPRLWKLCVPAGLRELLWKQIFDALPIGAKGDGRPHLQFCPCGRLEPLDLFHIFVGCSYFPISRLYGTVLFPALVATTPGAGSHITVDPERWFRLWWFPLLCFKRLAYFDSTKKQHASLFRSVRRREWIYGSFLWTLWHTRMKLANEPGFRFSLQQTQAILELKFAAFPG